MKRIFLDSNVWLRLFTDEPSPQFEACRELLAKIETGNFLPYASNIVLLEVAFTLKTYYKLRHPQIVTYLDTILHTRNLTIIERTDSRKALSLFSETKIKYADCLIATQIRPGMRLVTYDRDFEKLIPKQSITPAEVVN